MVTIIQKKKSAGLLVAGSCEIVSVGVQLSPQSPPYEVSFTSVDDAMAFVDRLHQSDGEQFALSVQSYLDAPTK